MTLQLHRPDGEGGLEPAPPAEADWRTQLESTRWGSGLEKDRLPELKNTEMNPTSRFRSVLFWLALAAATFVLILVGYGSTFWKFAPTTPAPSPSPAAIVRTV